MFLKGFAKRSRRLTLHIRTEWLHRAGLLPWRWHVAFYIKRSLPKALWTRAPDVAFYITNRCVTSSLPTGKTPYGLYTGEKPDVSNLRVFGRDAYKFTETRLPKLTAKAQCKTLVGYGPTEDSYLLYNREKKSIPVSRNVVFHEGSFGREVAAIIVADQATRLTLICGRELDPQVAADEDGESNMGTESAPRRGTS